MISGNKVSLRNVLVIDLDEFYRLTTDLNDAGEYMPMALTSEANFMDTFHQSGFWENNSGRLIIECNQTGEIVGEIGCFKATHYLDGREVYYRIFSGHRGKGFASEALSLFISLFFKTTSMNRLQGVTIVGNEASEHMLTKAGFQKEGTMRQARWFNGKVVDLNLFSLLRHDVTK